MDWRIRLPVLQAIAVCVGGRTLAGIFRVLSLDFKHFSGGLPDLLMIRVRKISNSSITHLDIPIWTQSIGGGLYSKNVASDAAFIEDVSFLSGGLEKGVSSDKIVGEDVPIDGKPPLVETDLVLPLNCDEVAYVFESTFVEVKGPTDRLSFRQQVWLQALEECGAHAWVCQVSEKD
jgi:hypothetical protein